MLIIRLVPMHVDRPTYGPYRVIRFSYTGNSTDYTGNSTDGGFMGSGYRLSAETEDGGTIMLNTGSENGRYALQVSQAD